MGNYKKQRMPDANPILLTRNSRSGVISRFYLMNQFFACAQQSPAVSAESRLDEPCEFW
jgi:hypothetical protein